MGTEIQTELVQILIGALGHSIAHLTLNSPDLRPLPLRGQQQRLGGGKEWVAENPSRGWRRVGFLLVHAPLSYQISLTNSKIK